MHMQINKWVVRMNHENKLIDRFVNVFKLKMDSKVPVSFIGSVQWSRTFQE